MRLVVAALAWLLLMGCEGLTPGPPLEHELTVTVSGSGIGRVVSAPAGINTAYNRYAASFADDTVVRLSAQASVGSTFIGFRFPAHRNRVCEAESADDTCTITLDQAVRVEAVFDLNETILDPERLTVVLDGTGSGSVTSHPAGIDSLAGDLTATFERGSVVRLDATPSVGSYFTGFTFVDDPDLDCEAGGADSTCLVVLEHATTVNVSFELSEDIAIGDRFDLVASVAVAAGQIEFDLPAGAGMVFARSLREDTIVRSSVAGGLARIVWLATRASSGPQLRIALDETLAVDTLDLRTQAFGSVRGEPANPDELTWLEADDAPPPPITFPDSVSLDATAELSASFADHPLGDLEPDRVLDVRDAMRWLEIVDERDATDFERYHADVDGDGVIDMRDLLLLLDRLVDPTLPARVQIKATPLSFVRLDPATGDEALILLANSGREAFSGSDLSWEVPAGMQVTEGGIEGQSLALRLTLPESARKGWLPGFARVAGPGAEATYRVGHLVLLVAGQSNASGRGEPLSGWPHAGDGSVRMLGNDYVWRDASEPLDDPRGQLDEVSEDSDPRYSFGSRVGELLVDATGFETYLIPAATGGVSVVEWLPSAPLERSTLYGSAHFRSLVSAALQTNPVSSQPHPSEGGPVNAVVWYQGESDGTRRSSFVRNTNQVMDAFTAHLGAPVIYVQLATHALETTHLRQHAVAELQRRMETGSGEPEARAVGFHMVVAFDLPRSDSIHLSAYGQRVLAERIDLAVRQHVLGEPVDGTGPRLSSISHTGTTVRLHTTHELESGSLDPELFAVFDGHPGDVDDADYGANAIALQAVTLDPDDVRAVWLRLASAPANTPYVRYMGEVGLLPNQGNSTPSDRGVWEIVASGTIRAAKGGLPLPTFGPLPPF